MPMASCSATTNCAAACSTARASTSAPAWSWTSGARSSPTAASPNCAQARCDPFGLDPARRVAKPMVVAGRGICFTAALELMLAADARVAADDARFGQIEVKRGIYAVGGATIRFCAEHRLGQQYALPAHRR